MASKVATDFTKLWNTISEHESVLNSPTGHAFADAIGRYQTDFLTNSFKVYYQLSPEQFENFHKFTGYSPVSLNPIRYSVLHMPCRIATDFLSSYLYVKQKLDGFNLLLLSPAPSQIEDALVAYPTSRIHVLISRNDVRDLGRLEDLRMWAKQSTLDIAREILNHIDDNSYAGTHCSIVDDYLAFRGRTDYIIAIDCFYTFHPNKVKVLMNQTYAKSVYFIQHHPGELFNNHSCAMNSLINPVFQIEWLKKKLCLKKKVIMKFFDDSTPYISDYKTLRAWSTYEFPKGVVWDPIYVNFGYGLYRFNRSLKGVMYLEPIYSTKNLLKRLFNVVAWLERGVIEDFFVDAQKYDAALYYCVNCIAQGLPIDPNKFLTHLRGALGKQNIGGVTVSHGWDLFERNLLLILQFIIFDVSVQKKEIQKTMKLTAKYFAANTLWKSIMFYVDQILARLERFFYGPGILEWLEDFKNLRPVGNIRKMAGNRMPLKTLGEPEKLDEVFMEIALMEKDDFEMLDQFKEMHGLTTTSKFWYNHSEQKLSELLPVFDGVKVLHNFGYAPGGFSDYFKERGFKIEDWEYKGPGALRTDKWTIDYSNKRHTFGAPACEFLNIDQIPHLEGGMLSDAAHCEDPWCPTCAKLVMDLVNLIARSPRLGVAVIKTNLRPSTIFHKVEDRSMDVFRLTSTRVMSSEIFLVYRYNLGEHIDFQLTTLHYNIEKSVKTKWSMNPYLRFKPTYIRPLTDDEVKRIKVNMYHDFVKWWDRFLDWKEQNKVNPDDLVAEDPTEPLKPDKVEESDDEQDDKPKKEEPKKEPENVPSMENPMTEAEYAREKKKASVPKTESKSDVVETKEDSKSDDISSEPYRPIYADPSPVVPKDVKIEKSNLGKWENTMKMIEKFIGGKISSLIDIGAGTSEFATFLRQKGVDACSADINGKCDITIDASKSVPAKIYKVAFMGMSLHHIGMFDVGRWLQDDSWIIIREHLISPTKSDPSKFTIEDAKRVHDGYKDSMNKPVFYVHYDNYAKLFSSHGYDYVDWHKGNAKGDESVWFCYRRTGRVTQVREKILFGTSNPTDFVSSDNGLKPIPNCAPLTYVDTGDKCKWTFFVTKDKDEKAFKEYDFNGRKVFQSLRVVDVEDDGYCYYYAARATKGLAPETLVKIPNYRPEVELEFVMRMASVYPTIIKREFVRNNVPYYVYMISTVGSTTGYVLCDTVNNPNHCKFLAPERIDTVGESRDFKDPYDIMNRSFSHDFSTDQAGYNLARTTIIGDLIRFPKTLAWLERKNMQNEKTLEKKMSYYATSLAPKVVHLLDGAAGFGKTVLLAKIAMKFLMTNKVWDSDKKKHIIDPIASLRMVAYGVTKRGSREEFESALWIEALNADKKFWTQKDHKLAFFNASLWKTTHVLAVLLNKEVKMLLLDEIFQIPTYFMIYFAYATAPDCKFICAGGSNQMCLDPKYYKSKEINGHQITLNNEWKMVLDNVDKVTKEPLQYWYFPYTRRHGPSAIRMLRDAKIPGADQMYSVILRPTKISVYAMNSKSSPLDFSNGSYWMIQSNSGEYAKSAYQSCKTIASSQGVSKDHVSLILPKRGLKEIREKYVALTRMKYSLDIYVDDSDVTIFRYWQDIAIRSGAQLFGGTFRPLSEYVVGLDYERNHYLEPSTYENSTFRDNTIHDQVKELAAPWVNGAIKEDISLISRSHVPHYKPLSFHRFTAADLLTLDHCWNSYNAHGVSMKYTSPDVKNMGVHSDQLIYKDFKITSLGDDVQGKRHFAMSAVQSLQTLTGRLTAAAKLQRKANKRFNQMSSAQYNKFFNDLELKFWMFYIDAEKFEKLLSNEMMDTVLTECWNEFCKTVNWTNADCDNIVSNRFQTMRGMLKQQMKFKGREAPFENKPGQPIAAVSKMTVALYAILFRFMVRLMKLSLSDKFLMATGKSNEEIAQWMNDNSENVKEIWMTDAKEFDASQNKHTQNIVRLIFRMFSPDLARVDAYYSTISTQTVYYMVAIMFWGESKPSGAPDTLDGNVVLCMVLVMTLYPDGTIEWAIFLGDDTAVGVNTYIQKLNTSVYDMFFSFPLKIQKHPRVTEFCNHLFAYGTFIYNPIVLAGKIIQKNYGQVLKDRLTWEEWRLSINVVFWTVRRDFWKIVDICADWFGMGHEQVQRLLVTLDAYCALSYEAARIHLPLMEVVLTDSLVGGNGAKNNLDSLNSAYHSSKLMTTAQTLQHRLIETGASIIDVDSKAVGPAQAPIWLTNLAISYPGPLSIKKVFVGKGSTKARSLEAAQKLALDDLNDNCNEEPSMDLGREIVVLKGQVAVLKDTMMMFAQALANVTKAPVSIKSFEIPKDRNNNNFVIDDEFDWDFKGKLDDLTPEQRSLVEAMARCNNKKTHSTNGNILCSGSYAEIVDKNSSTMQLNFAEDWDFKDVSVEFHSFEHFRKVLLNDAFAWRRIANFGGFGSVNEAMHALNGNIDAIQARIEEKRDAIRASFDAYTVKQPVMKGPKAAAFTAFLASIAQDEVDDGYALYLQATQNRSQHAMNGNSQASLPQRKPKPGPRVAKRIAEKAIEKGVQQAVKKELKKEKKAHNPMAVVQTIRKRKGPINIVVPRQKNIPRSIKRAAKGNNVLADLLGGMMIPYQLNKDGVQWPRTDQDVATHPRRIEERIETPWDTDVAQSSWPFQQLPVGHQMIMVSRDYLCNKILYYPNANKEGWSYLLYGYGKAGTNTQNVTLYGFDSWIPVPVFYGLPRSTYQNGTAIVGSFQPHKDVWYGGQVSKYPNHRFFWMNKGATGATGGNQLSAVIQNDALNTSDIVATAQVIIYTKAEGPTVINLGTTPPISPGANSTLAINANSFPDKYQYGAYCALQVYVTVSGDIPSGYTISASIDSVGNPATVDNSCVFGHQRHSTALALQTAVEQLNISGVSSWYMNKAAPSYMNGDINVQQVPGTECWTKMISDLETFRTDQRTKTFLAVKGQYSYLKPNSNSFVMTAPFISKSNTVQDVYWNIDSQLDYLLTVINVDESSLGVSQAGNFFIGTNFEFSSNNQLYMPKPCPATILMGMHVLDLLRNRPQHFENGKHLQQIGGFIKKAISFTKKALPYIEPLVELAF